MSIREDEVRAAGLRAMRRKHGLTQRQLGKDLGLSLHYISAIEEGARRGSPKLHERPGEIFRLPVRVLFEVILVDPSSGGLQILEADSIR
jgi:transcriptional regulator with XRE-family HTH domain